MVTINLQWLAYPCWFFAVINLLIVICYGIPPLFQGEIMPLLGISVIVRNGLWTIGLTILGFLIWMAFRQVPTI